MSFIEKDNNDYNIQEKYGNCGIITTCFTDPISKIINKIKDVGDDEVSGVGFYYKKNGKYITYIYNTHDNQPKTIIKFGILLDSLFLCPYIKKITFYPFKINDNEKIITSRKHISNKNIVVKVTTENNYIEIIENTVNKYNLIESNKVNGYKIIFYEMVNIVNEKYEMLKNKHVTGYMIVNEVMSILMKDERICNVKNELVMTSLINPPVCHFLKNDVTYETTDIKDELGIIMTVFGDLIFTCKQFRENLLKMEKNTATKKIFEHEEKIIHHLLSSIRSSSLDINIVNDMITNVNSERFLTGKKLYSLCEKNVDNIIVKSENSFTYKEHGTIKEYNPINELKTYIEHIISESQQENPLIINLDHLLKIYNKLAEKTKHEKIIIDKNITHSISKPATIIIPEKHHQIKNDNVILTMYEPNLTTLTDHELMDILIYIDSLGKNNKFSHIKNEIVNELGIRSKK